MINFGIGAEICQIQFRRKLDLSADFISKDVEALEGNGQNIWRPVDLETFDRPGLPPTLFALIHVRPVQYFFVSKMFQTVRQGFAILK